MKLTFYGGAESVTGANYLLESGDHRLIVDCGLIQGSNYAEKQNYEPFPYKPSEVQVVLVTHAHLDHIGRLPKLYAEGFSGSVYSTEPTRDFAEVSLLDSEHILGREAEREHKEPFCTADNVEGMMRLWKGVKYHEPFTVGPFTIEFFDAGHILGSSMIRVEVEGKKILFSGDLGNSPAPIIRPLEYIDSADYVLVESAYGDRNHENVSRREEMLEDVIEDTVRRGGTLLIPIFALERTQEILFHMHKLFLQGRVPRVPVYLDSPLAIKLTDVYKKYEDYFNKETIRIVESGADILNFPGLKFTLSTEESKKINTAPSPKIILAGSGMSQGGRIMHHEKLYLPDPKNTILFVGFQTSRSLGRQIMEGAKSVMIAGEHVPVRAELRTISSYSAHADQQQLLRWLKPLRLSAKKVFVVQGDEGSSAVLAQKIRDDLAMDAVVPQIGMSVEL